MDDDGAATTSTTSTGSRTGIPRATIVPPPHGCRAVDPRHRVPPKQKLFDLVDIGNAYPLQQGALLGRQRHADALPRRRRCHGSVDVF